MIDGPSPEHELVLQGRLEGQAPGHRPGGLPDRLRPGDRTRPATSSGAPIVGARGYDLVAAPSRR